VKAAEEIGQSEESLLGDLVVLRDVFLGPLKKWVGDQRVDLVDRLLEPLEGVIAFSTTFLGEIKAAERRGAWRSLFERNEETMAARYGAYVAGYEGAWAELASYREKTPTADAFLRCAELQPANSRGLSFASLAIAPVQRGPRYGLLMDTLAKRADKANFSYAEATHGDDAAGLASALDCARRTAKAIENHIRLEERRVADVKRVAALFVPSPTTDAWTKSSSKRRTVLKEDALMRTTKQRSHADAYFVLFDDRLAYGDAVDSATSKAAFAAARRRRTSLDLGGSADNSGGGGTPTTKRSSLSSFSGSSSSAVNSSSGLYALRSDHDVGLCRAARGDSLGDTLGPVALDPWEFVVVFLRDNEKAAAFVVAANTPTLASDWVDALNDAADKRRQLTNQPDFPDRFVVSAYVHRQGKVVVADYEIHRKNQHFLAKPTTKKGSSSAAVAAGGQAIAMPGLLQTRSSNDFPTTTRPPSTATASSSPRTTTTNSPRPRRSESVGDDNNSSPTTTSGDLRGADLFRTSTSVEELCVVLHGDEGMGLELRNEDGAVVVTSMAPASSAAQAGIRVGDALLKVNHKAVTSTVDVVTALGARADGCVDVLVQRRGGSEDPPPPPPPNASDPVVEARSVEAQAIAMGFTADDVHRALARGAGPDVNSVVLWIIDHPLIDLDDGAPPPVHTTTGNRPPPPTPLTPAPGISFVDNPFR